MWKKLLAWILITVILIGNGIQVVEAFEQSGNVQMEKIMGEPDQNSLYARSAVLMDADSGRILYEKMDIRRWQMRVQQKFLPVSLHLKIVS